MIIDSFVGPENGNGVITQMVTSDFGSAATTLVIEGGTLIDGTGKAPLEDSVIVIEGDRFKAVGANGQIPIPPRSQVINVKGKTVLPGFIDGHAHWEDFDGELYLHLGITSIANIHLYQNGPWILAQRDGTNLGKIRGPRIWASGRAIGTRQGITVTESVRSAAGNIAVSSGEEARAIVRRKKQAGYDIIKINEFVPIEWVKEITDEAHHLGLRVAGHSWDAIGSSRAGIDSIEHIVSVGISSIADVARRLRIGTDRLAGKIDQEQVGIYYESNNYGDIMAAMVDHGVAWTPTIAKSFRPLSRSAERFKAREESLLSNPNAQYFPAALRSVVARVYERIDKYAPEQLERAKIAYGNSLEFIRRFVQVGGILKEGSDPPEGMPGLQMHIGMAMDVEAGVPPMTTIQAATLNAAKTFGKDKDFGSVEAGKVADLNIISGDPLRDIWMTQNVTMVVMNGKLVDIGFHADWKNPIPSPLPPYSIPWNIGIAPVAVTQGSGPTTLKVTGKKMRRYHRVTLNGQELETHFVREDLLEAIIPPEMIEAAGLYTVKVISPRASGGESHPAHLIVRFKQ
ncbi:MAG: amidohydrolase family protein [Deltaproteobacteria bacterium]|nr:amidohydrolase family protein [Deltaproteobacteria bacterium]